MSDLVVTPPLQPHEHIIVALDVDSLDVALEIVDELKDHVGLFKIGLELVFTIFVQLITPTSIREALRNLHKVRMLFALLHGRHMFDVKLKDISNTMAGAAAAIAKLAVTMYTLHASAGVKGMRKAVERSGKSRPIAVTALTSLDEDECIASYGVGSLESVDKFRQMAYEAGVRLLVCAPKDAEFFLQPEPDGKTLGMQYICPNIRPTWAIVKTDAPKKDDQNLDRSMTPGDAARVGITYMVIGRPITKPPPDKFATRRAAAEAIAEEIAMALGQTSL